MTLFFYVVLGLLALDLFGKIIILFQRDTHRSLGATTFDAIVTAGLLVWGAFVLGGK